MVGGIPCDLAVAIIAAVDLKIAGDKPCNCVDADGLSRVQFELMDAGPLGVIEVFGNRG